MNIPFDDHGQPLSDRINRRQRIDRDISELLGVAKGILSDGVVTNDEARFLHDWSRNHPDAVAQWPVSIIFVRLQQILADGAVDEAERVDLNELLTHLVGGTITLLLGCEGATTLPLDDPPPPIAYGPGEVFVFTGKMAYGPRYKCVEEVTRRSSRCESDVTRDTTFLVVGTFGSRDWAHTSYGRKIERAVQLRDRGFPLRIVGEDHWGAALAPV